MAKSRTFSEKYPYPKSVCFCGHVGDGPGSVHAGPFGHGPCTVRWCGCSKFTWKGFTPLFEKDFARRSKKMGTVRLTSR